MKNILLTIVLTVVFFGGAYLMGNYVLGTFKADAVDQIISSIYGILLWVAIGVMALIVYGIYQFVCWFSA